MNTLTVTLLSAAIYHYQGFNRDFGCVPCRDFQLSP